MKQILHTRTQTLTLETAKNAKKRKKCPNYKSRRINQKRQIEALKDLKSQSKSVLQYVVSMMIRS